MFVIEYKVKASKTQYNAIDEAIRTVQFIRNKCLRYWMDNNGVGKYDLSKLCKQLAEEFDFAKKLNSQARQASSETGAKVRTWAAINRFYKNCKAGIKGKKGYPKFQKNNRSVEYKTTGWKLDPNTKKHITFTDKNNIGRLKLIGSRDIYFYSPDQIKRVRLVRRADGYYCQFCINVNVTEDVKPTKQILGLDVGLHDFYTDSEGHKEPNPRFFRKGEEELKRCQRRLSRKQKGSNNRGKARQRLAKKHLKISRQRREHASATRWVVKSQGSQTSFRAIPDENSPWSPSELYLLIGEAHLPSPIIPMCGMTSLPLSKRWLRDDKAG
ncbi:transposase IS891/IS1136/IS1341 family [Halothece sp. PCC 7418]|uniref:RNA-guided endonuclease InsQ/TnpB family protein n=1 Tax=Halothece sp. (strain PCC 7418) TaxID=65093 RepID=UPI0002A05E52|nr:RNA-guided endonuclease TnpB family protein [Halothece sp. PCC 7418]AFZ45426.1 transposase IS891/IS1136/IS1341 family [Halothece sp. PCC 7418]